MPNETCTCGGALGPLGNTGRLQCVRDKCLTVFEQPALSGLRKLRARLEAADKVIQCWKAEDKLRWEMDVERPDSQEALDAWTDAKINRDEAVAAYERLREKEKP
ncbi:MAG: hypothetical protein WC683_05995 [bacterium]